MHFTRFDIDGPVLIEGSVFKDVRGAFYETWRALEFADNSLSDDWAQENISVSLVSGTVRGLHWQVAPHAQAKLVRPVTGRILDVVVDLRRTSLGFSKAMAIELNSAQNQQLYVPVGFAHGFCTLEPNTIVSYKASSLYAPEAERRLLWTDPDLDIDWPVIRSKAILADKDLTAPTLKELAVGDLF
jgi:dTDP-4-dehydrorhamnose 3,5-epimerase